MKLEDVRKEIDALDPQIKTLILRRMDCSLEVAKAKQAAGETTIYRRDREKAILDRLGADVPADRLPEYLAVVRKSWKQAACFNMACSLIGIRIFSRNFLPALTRLPAAGASRFV